MADENGEQTAPTALDAVNAALAGETPPAPVDDEVLADGDPAADTAADETSEEVAKEGETALADAEAAKGRERNPDGTFKSAEQKAAEAAAKPGEKPAEKPGEKAAEKKTADPLNDPIPKDLKPATQERIRTLIDTTKKVTAERDEVSQNFNTIVNGLQATGTTPEQYGEVLSFMALFNSGDPAQQAQALEAVEAVAERLATMLGRERTVSDPLAKHLDLKAAVAAGQTTQALAREIARTRERDGMRTELDQTARQQQQQQNQQVQERQNAVHALNVREAALKASDPQYDAKRAHLLPILKPLFESLPPSKWREAFDQAYAAMKLAPAARPVAKPAAGGTPLRAKSSGGAAGGVKPAATALDAMNAALSGRS